MSGRAHELFQHPVFANGAVGGLYNHDMLIGVPRRSRGKAAKTTTPGIARAPAKARSKGAELAANVFKDGVAEGKREAAQLRRRRNKKGKGARKANSALRVQALKAEIDMCKKGAAAAHQLANMPDAPPSGPTPQGPGKAKGGPGAAPDRPKRQYSAEETAAYLERCKKAEEYWPELLQVYPNPTEELFYRDDFQELKAMNKMMRKRRQIAPEQDNATVSDTIIAAFKAQSKMRSKHSKATRLYWKKKDSSEIDKLDEITKERLLNRREKDGGESAEGAAEVEAVPEKTAEELERERLQREYEQNMLDSAAKPSILQRLNMI